MKITIIFILLISCFLSANFLKIKQNSGSADYTAKSTNSGGTKSETKKQETDKNPADAKDATKESNKKETENKSTNTGGNAFGQQKA